MVRSGDIEHFIFFGEAAYGYGYGPSALCGLINGSDELHYGPGKVQEASLINRVDLTGKE
jgi:hypothetical protein